MRCLRAQVCLRLATKLHLRKLSRWVLLFACIPLLLLVPSPFLILVYRLNSSSEAFATKGQYVQPFRPRTRMASHLQPRNCLASHLWPRTRMASVCALVEPVFLAVFGGG